MLPASSITPCSTFYIISQPHPLCHKEKQTHSVLVAEMRGGGPGEDRLSSVTRSTNKMQGRGRAAIARNAKRNVICYIMWAQSRIAISQLNA